MKKNKNLFLERSFFEKFNSQVAIRGNETAIIIEQNGIEVTYENLSSDVKKIAYHLWSCGVRNGMLSRANCLMAMKLFLCF